MGLTSTTSRRSDNEGSADWWKTLPFDLQDVRVSLGSRPVGFRYSQSIVNIDADFGSLSINACGEANSSDLAMTKAIAELVERLAMTEWCRANPLAGITTSNGWAAHENLYHAKVSAALERVERDAVLAQWYTATPFIELDPESLPLEVLMWSRTELATSELPRLRILLSTEGLGPSVTCLFVNENGYGVSGHATRTSLSESIESAIGEACRAAHHFIRRSFWNDSLALRDGKSSDRVEPGTHAVYYAYHEPFPVWMFGKQITWLEAERQWNQKLDAFYAREFSRFSFQMILEDPFIVGFATHPECLGLTWGATDSIGVLKMAENRKFSVALTDENLNRQPHIVS